jgi:hypothetical protein
MKRKAFCVAVFTSLVTVVVLGAGWQTQAEDTKSPYPVMAPVDQYLMDRTAEIALARSAAPDSISRDAEVMVLTRHGFEIAVQGKNQFVCMVERSWSAGTDDPVFWNPKIRGPICFNPAGARYNVPITLKRTEVVLATQSKTEMAKAVEAAFEKKEIPALEPGAMCFMMSKQQYLSDNGGHSWHPHLMFFVQGTEAAAWGAGLEGSPVLGFENTVDRYTLFMVPIGKWSDGTPAHENGN